MQAPSHRSLLQNNITEINAHCWTVSSLGHDSLLFSGRNLSISFIKLKLQHPPWICFQSEALFSKLNKGLTLIPIIDFKVFHPTMENWYFICIESILKYLHTMKYTCRAYSQNPHIFLYPLKKIPYIKITSGTAEIPHCVVTWTLNAASILL